MATVLEGSASSPPMIVIIPLGGLGTRFKAVGHLQPKALVPVQGKPIIFWLIDNMNLPPGALLCIPYNSEYRAHNLEQILQERYCHLQIRFLCLEEQTRGAAETLLVCLKDLCEREPGLRNAATSQPSAAGVPVASVDSDSFYTYDFLAAWKGQNAVYSFSDSNPQPIFSYVATSGNTKRTTLDGEGGSGEDWRIQKIVEKEKISDWANCGVYAFASHLQLMQYCERIIEQNIRQKNEFYTSTVIAEMIQDGITFYCRPVANKHFYSLGTPEQVAQFNTTYLLDLDGTLVDTDSVYVKVWNNLLSPFGLSIDESFFDDFIKGNSDNDFLKYLMPDISPDLLESFSTRKDSEFIRVLQERAADGEDLAKLVLIDGVEAFMHRAKNSKVAIVTSCNRAAAEFLVQATGLEDFVCLLVASEDCKRHKPHPEPYRHAMQLLGVSGERCVICEDSASGIMAASHACAGRVCFFTRGAANAEDAARSGEIAKMADVSFSTWDSMLPASIAMELEQCATSSDGGRSPKNNEFAFFAAQIKRKLSTCMPIRAVSHSQENLKTGYICDINAFNLEYLNGDKRTVVFKISNFGNELAKTATQLDMYEKEGFFYEKLGNIVKNEIGVPQCYGVIRESGGQLIRSGANSPSSSPFTDNASPMPPAKPMAPIGVLNEPPPRVGIILEDLRTHPGCFNVDLSQDVRMLSKVVSCAFNMHRAYYFKTPYEVIRPMKPLVTASDITYYQTLVQNRFDIFIRRNAVFMSDKSKALCEAIAKNYKKIANGLSEFPLSFCHGDLKSPNIFYKFRRLDVAKSGNGEPYPGIGSAMDAEPIFLDWQYIHLNKGVSDIVFLLVESIKFDKIPVDFALNFYYSLWREKERGYTYEQYRKDVTLSLCLFPFFVMVWFNSEDQDKLLDKSFPIKFMKNLLEYYNEYVDLETLVNL
ncbi:unnamed protein product [Amoebophrya sp. A25]|nr:unnamed protein product [Amoebophrya sp. A25]|eukprot:GSA25T00021339001.1